MMQFLKIRVLHTDDSAHQIALGAALGLFIAWTPALGLHILMALGLTILLRANKFVALACVWASNPFTMILVYYPNYLLGRVLLKSFCPSQSLSRAQIREMFGQLNSSTLLTSFFKAEFWQNLLRLLWVGSLELWIGSIIMGLFVGLVGYFVTYKFTVWYRKKHPHRRFLQHQ